MTAVTCILGPLAIPIGPVPVSLTPLAVFLSVYILGTKGGTLAYLLYLLIGAVGVPVFSGFTGGLGKLAGPTGGYLVGFILMALIPSLAQSVSKLIANWDDYTRKAQELVTKLSAFAAEKNINVDASKLFDAVENFMGKSVVWIKGNVKTILSTLGSVGSEPRLLFEQYSVFT